MDTELSDIVSEEKITELEDGKILDEMRFPVFAEAGKGPGKETERMAEYVVMVRR